MSSGPSWSSKESIKALLDSTLITESFERRPIRGIDFDDDFVKNWPSTWSHRIIKVAKIDRATLSFNIDFDLNNIIYVFIDYSLFKN